MIADYIFCYIEGVFYQLVHVAHMLVNIFNKRGHIKNTLKTSVLLDT